jgi:hypothetical protein
MLILTTSLTLKEWWNILGPHLTLLLTRKIVGQQPLMGIK